MLANQLNFVAKTFEAENNTRLFSCNAISRLPGEKSFIFNCYDIIISISIHKG
jgi:hypothetical protein